jgi:predicted P-loop ATPase
MAIDIEGVKAAAVLADVVQSHGVKLRRDGQEWVGLCPFHKEKTPSFRVYPDQHYYCFGCQAHGDVLDFLRERYGVGLREAAEMLGAGEGGDRAQAVTGKPQEPVRDIYAGLVTLLAAPTVEAGKPLTIWNAKRDSWSTLTPSMVFRYPGQGVVIRVDIGGGRKITPMLRWVTKLADGKFCWAMCPFDRPRPLYGDVDGPQVLVVEGEKAADAARRLLGMPAVTWPGGGSGAKHTDWSQVEGKKLVLWPDADQQGWDVMNGWRDDKGVWHPGVAEMATEAGAAEVKVAGWDKDKPKGWDAADAEAEGWDRARVLSWLRARAGVWAQAGVTQKAAAESPSSEPPAKVTEKPQRVTEARTVQQEKPVATVTPIERPSQRLAPDDLWRRDFIFGADNLPKPKLMHNMVLMLTQHPDTRGVFAYDQFSNQITLLRRPPWERGDAWQQRPVTDADGRACMQWMELQDLRPKLTDTHTAIEGAADKLSFNPVTDWFDGLAWDGHKRLDTWLTYYLGADDKAFTRLVAAKWMISGVARAYEPGCKVDTMLILEGAQGIGKSKVMRTLGTLGGRSYFTDQVDNIGSKDAAMQLQGVLIIEMAEMNQLHGKEITAVKAWMTQTVDRFRPPFGRRVMSYPRHSILGGTLNPDGSGYFEDVTGARRFWPVLCRAIDMDALDRDRDQLWAEARDRYRSGERWWLDEDGVALAKVEQDDRYLTEPIEDIVLEYIADKMSVNGTDVLIHGVGVPKERLTKQLSQKVARILFKAGWTRDRGWDKTARRTRILYYAPGLKRAEMKEEG